MTASRVMSRTVRPQPRVGELWRHLKVNVPDGGTPEQRAAWVRLEPRPDLVGVVSVADQKGYVVLVMERWRSAPLARIPLDEFLIDWRPVQ